MIVPNKEIELQIYDLNSDHEKVKASKKGCCWSKDRETHIQF